MICSSELFNAYRTPTYYVSIHLKPADLLREFQSLNKSLKTRGLRVDLLLLHVGIIEQ